MHRVVPAEKDAANTKLEERQQVAANQLRTNSGLNTAQYSAPVLGLIFLRFEDVRFVACRAQLAKASVYARHCGSQVDQAAAYHAEDVRYLAPDTSFDHCQTVVMPARPRTRRCATLIGTIRCSLVC